MNNIRISFFKVLPVIFFLLIFNIHSIESKANEPIDFIMVNNSVQLDSVRMISKNTGKPVFAEFYSASCHWCKQADTTTLRDTSLARFLNNGFISAKVRLDSDFGMEMIKKYEIFSLPAYIMLDERGRMIFRLLGGQSPQTIITEFSSFLDSYKKHITFKAEFSANNRNPEFLIDYSHLLFTLNLFDDARLITNVYFNTVKVPLINSSLWDVISHTMYYDYGKPMNWVITKYDSLVGAFGCYRVNRFLDSAFASLFEKSILRKDTFILNTAFSILNVVKDSNGNHIGSERKRDVYRLNYYYAIEDWNTFARSSSDFVLRYSVETFELREFIIIFCEKISNKEFLYLADSWAKSLWDKEKSFDNCLSYANTSFKTGNINKTFRLLKRAKKLAQDEKEETMLSELRNSFKMNE
jgi:thioredoxin-related protein